MEVDSECSPPPSLSLLLKIPFESWMYVLMTVLYSPFPQNRFHVDEEHADVVLNVAILGKNLEWHFLTGYLSYSKSLKYFPCKLL